MKGVKSQHLAMRVCKIAHATGDADVPIIQAAVTVSDTYEAVLVGDDTALLVLLIHLADLNKENIYFRPEPKKGGALRCIGVSSIRNKLRENICGNILFVHAFLGVILHPGYLGSGEQLDLHLSKRLSVNRLKSSSSSVLVLHSKLNIVVPAHACGNKLKVVIIMLICIGPYTV